MDGTELGKKIKEARIAKKMTQNEVVGTFITRNMLSQIESGAACPSVKTLQYLAGVLDLPLNYLIPEETRNTVSEQVFTEVDCYCSAKADYMDGKYKESIEKLEPLVKSVNALYDEAVLLLGMSYLQLAKAEESSNPEKALNYAEKAESISGKGIYSGREVKTSALFIMNRISEKLIGK